MPLGINDLKNISLPAAWDAAELKRLQMRGGVTAEQILRDIDDALGLLNDSLTSGYLGLLFSLTTEPAVEYRVGVSNGFEDATEYGQPDGQRAETSGHMLPIKIKDRKMGWTYLWLQEARRSAIDADIASLIEDAKNAWEKAIFTRLFKLEEETGKLNGLGAGGVSVPFCDGGIGTIAFTPVAKPDRGGTFLSSHSHFLRLNGITQANLETAVKHIWEHGHDGPFDLIVSLADLASWTNTSNVTGYVAKADSSIMYGNNVNLANVGDFYIGGVKTEYGFCRLYASGRIPTGYWSVVKVYGQQDQRNALRVRWDELFGFGVKLITEKVGQYPIEGAIGMMKFGVGVGEDRTAAVLVKNDTTGNYSTPTIS